MTSSTPTASASKGVATMTHTTAQGSAAQTPATQTPADPGSPALWRVAGGLMIGYVVLTFVGVAFEHTLSLGDKASVASAALTQSSLAKNFTGGYIEFLATLIFLVGA